MPVGTTVGNVAECWRFPVKSMQGEAVEQLDVGANGCAGDRAYAVVDATSGRTLSAKTVSALLDAYARHDGHDVVIELPDGTTFSAAHSRRANDLLSAWLDRRVELRPTGAGVHASYDMTFDPPNDAADYVEIPCPEATFFDAAAVHALSTNSLRSCASAYAGATWDRRRFRPNVLAESTSDEPYPEDAWVGHDIALGTVTLQVLMRTVRCAMPLRAQPVLGDERALARDVDIYRTMDRVHDNHLGVYLSVRTPGVVALGDAITLS